MANELISVKRIGDFDSASKFAAFKALCINSDMDKSAATISCEENCGLETMTSGKLGTLFTESRLQDKLGPVGVIGAHMGKTKGGSLVF